MSIQSNEYLIGKGFTQSGEPFWIGYRSMGREAAGYPEAIAARVGNGPDCLGLAVSGSSMLAFKNIYREWVSEGGKFKLGGDIEEIDWFEHRCKEANCEWFLGIVKRMAAGQTVPLEEIQAAYLEHNGSPMPCGKWSNLFQ